MKKEFVVSRRGWGLPLAHKSWCSIFCLIALTAVSFWSPSPALAQSQTEGAPLTLNFVLMGPKPIFTHGGTHTLTYQVSNYTGGLIGTITAMQVYVDGSPILTTFDNVAHAGYGSWNTSGLLNPSHHTAHATAFVNTLDVYGNPIPNDFPMYDRAAQRDILKPQMSRFWSSNFGVINMQNDPAGYIKGDAPTVKFGVDVPNMNNVQAVYRWQLWLENESYSYQVLDQSLSGDLDNVVTWPALPDYVFAHLVRMRIWLWFWSPNEQTWYSYQSWGQIIGDIDGPALDWTTKWYAVFSDPNATFPRYKWGGEGAFQTKPWYQIIENALNHVTESGTKKGDTGVTDPTVGMQNLTTDLYVWPERPNGPATSSYEPGDESGSGGPYYYRLTPPPPTTPTAAVFDLWGMTEATRGDCQDFSSYLQCQARALGIHNIACKTLTSPFVKFVCNPLLFCSEETWRYEQRFTLHQVVCRSGTELYDWAFAFQDNNARGWTLCIAYNDTQEKNALVKSDSPVQPRWGTPFALGIDQDPDYGVETYVK